MESKVDNIYKSRASEIDEFEKQIKDSIERREEITKANIKKAEACGFKNVPDKVELTDQFGFIQSGTRYEIVLVLQSYNNIICLVIRRNIC